MGVGEVVVMGEEEVTAALAVEDMELTTVMVMVHSVGTIMTPGQAKAS